MNHFSAAYRSEFARRSTPRRGFTLVELLVVIVIISMLATLSVAAMTQSREAARISRTKALIAKIDTVVMKRYSSYQTRRMKPIAGRRSPKKAAEVRLNLLRDTMRMEMPQHWRDVQDPPVGYAAGAYQAERPALSRSYRRVMNQLTPTKEYESAECLYLIVTLGDPESRSQFHDTEFGDVDQDGAREFIDGWGNPIGFLRWAPGVTESDVQAMVAEVPFTGDIDMALAADAAQNDHDPFDVRNVDFSTDMAAGDPNYPPRSWRLIPLVYSAGPDGVYDIREDQELPSAAGTFYELSGNPFYFLDPPSGGTRVPLTLGIPTDPDLDGFGHYDNITNHRIEMN